MEKFCLQCGAPLILKSVAADPVYPYGPQVSACSSCNSRSYAVSGNKIKELTAQRDELLAALKDIVDGNDLAMERNQDMSSWRESDFRRHAVTIIEKIEGK